MLRKISFYGSVAAIYIFTIGTIGATLYSSHFFETSVLAEAPKQTIYRSITLPAKTISGKPVRIIISDRAIDLPIDEGFYDSKSRTWTLSETHAQYAVATAPANDRNGTTFIYGHGTDQVFGKIGSNRPELGTRAEIHTDNGRVFTYRLSLIQDLKPSDTWILNNTAGGPPRLIIQTCTGAFSEWRTMFVFNFEKVT